MATAAPAPIRVGVERAAAPLALVNAEGRPVGFTVELLQAMEREAGVDIEIVPGYWVNHVPDIKAGRIQAIGNVVATENNLAEYDLSIPHAELHGLVFYRADRPPIQRSADFAGRIIGTVKGTAASTDAVRRGGWGGTVRIYSTLQEALDATHAGDCDVTFVINRSEVTRVNRHQLKYGTVADIIYQLHFGVRKGDAATLARLNEGLAVVLRNGTFDRIFAEWIGPIEPHPIRFADLRPYLLPATAVLLAIAAFIFWQRHIMRRLARQAMDLRQSEERWKFALEGSNAAVWDWNIADGTVLFSKEWREMLGFAEHDLEPTLATAEKLVHEDDVAATWAALQLHLDNQDVPFAVEFRTRCKDGSMKWVLNRGMVVRRDPQGKALRMIGTYSDLTDRKQAEEHRLIRGKLESTGILAGGIAHDFNNLLGAIVLSADLALWPDEPRESVAQRLRDMKKAALAANDLTQQLITFAKGGASVPQPTRLDEILRTALDQAMAGAAHGREIQCPDDLWVANVDRKQIAQVIRNLLANAREAMPGTGTVVVKASNEEVAANAVPSLAPGRYVRISVSDTGEGIPPDRLATVFDPYYSTKQRGAQKGMGLGLTISLSVVRQHGGTITVESTPHVGSTFSVFLPACAADEPAAASAGARHDPRPSARILVMDDEADLRTTIGASVRQLGYEVELVSDGAEAIQCYQQAQAAGQPFAAVILDLVVRGRMGGLDTVHALRRIDPGVNAVVMSGFTDSEGLRYHATHGFKGALKKPFTLESLREAIAAATLPVPPASDHSAPRV